MLERMFQTASYTLDAQHEVGMHAVLLQRVYA